MLEKLIHGFMPRYREPGRAVETPHKSVITVFRRNDYHDGIHVKRIRDTRSCGVVREGEGANRGPILQRRETRAMIRMSRAAPNRRCMHVARATTLAWLGNIFTRLRLCFLQVKYPGQGRAVGWSPWSAARNFVFMRFVSVFRTPSIRSAIRRMILAGVDHEFID